MATASNNNTIQLYSTYTLDK